MALPRESAPRPSTTEFIDLDSAQQLKPARKVSDQFMGQVPKPGSGGIMPPEAAQFLLQSLGATTNGDTPGPQVQAPQAREPALLVTEPTVQPAPQPLPQGSRVQARIDKLYGKMKSAEERATDAESKYAEVIRRLDMLQAPRAPMAQAAPPPAAYDPFAPIPSQENSQAGPFVSRQELLEIVNRQTQELARAQAIQQAHTVSWGEAQRDFPEVFSTPDLKDAADRIWSEDQNLHRDPMGPYKAAALARGMFLGAPGAGGGGQQSAMAQKQLLSGLGSTVPEGAGNPEDRVTRYQKAIALARETGSTEHAAAAWKIMMGME